MSFERAREKAEDLAGAARARMGDMTQAERAEAERTRQRDSRARQTGEGVQETGQDVRETFTR